MPITDIYIYIYYDNQSTIRLLKSGPNSSKCKHIDADYYYIQDIVERNEVIVSFLPSADMVADPLTKGISVECFTKHISLMRLREA